MARDPDRIPRVLAKLRAVWERYPDMRLGQLYINLWAESPVSPWHFEDDAFESALNGLIETGGFAQAKNTPTKPYPFNLFGARKSGVK